MVGPGYVPAFPRDTWTPPRQLNEAMNRTAVAVLFLAVCPSALEGQIGVIGGFNSDTFGSFANEDFELAEQTTGFNTGIFLDFELGRFGIRPAITYRQLKNAIVHGEEVGQTANLEIVEIPLDFRVSAPLPVIKPYLLAGPAVIFPSSPRPEADQALAGARLGIGIGLGAEWDIGFRLWPEIRYSTTIGGIMEDDTTRGSRLSTFIARLGISF